MDRLGPSSSPQTLIPLMVPVPLVDVPFWIHSDSELVEALTEQRPSDAGRAFCRNTR